MSYDAGLTKGYIKVEPRTTLKDNFGTISEQKVVNYN